MNTHPILFSGPMVNAILEGRKTQTRRVMKPQPMQRAHRGQTWGQKEGFEWAGIWTAKDSFAKNVVELCPYGLRGDRLWVRETHYRYGYWRKNGLTKAGSQAWVFIAIPDARVPEKFESVYYAASGQPPAPILTKRSSKRGWYKRPSIFLPRDYSRLKLSITDVRVERLSAISDADIVAEGITLPGQVLFPSTNREYKLRQQWEWGWDKINGKRKGCDRDSDPWLWVVSFRRIES